MILRILLLYALPSCSVALLLQIPWNFLLSLCCCFMGMSTLLSPFLPHILVSLSWWLLKAFSVLFWNLVQLLLYQIAQALTGCRCPGLAVSVFWCRFM